MILICIECIICIKIKHKNNKNLFLNNKTNIWKVIKLKKCVKLKQIKIYILKKVKKNKQITFFKVIGI